jgi:amino acid transporter
MKLRRSLTTLSLVFVLYFNVSGGPFTIEALVGQIGPGLAFLILILIPIFWSLPETLIVGELASVLPEEGGYYRWVYRAFGPFWAFQNGWWTWVYSLVDMAIYPVLFNQYLLFFFPDLGSRASWCVSLAVIWGATAINLRGAFPVGRVSIVSGLFVIAGFLAMALSALPRIGHVPWVPFAAAGANPLGALGVGLSIALWNYIGWDNASTVQGEVIDASRAYPRALAFTLPLVTAGYLIPVAAAAGASDWSTWKDGGWPDIARGVGGVFGRPIAIWIALAGMISALALFNALLMSYSRISLAMANDGLLPRFLAATDARGTPVNAILVSAVFYSIFALAPFHGLVVADVLLYAMALFLEFGALIALRRNEPALRGVFRIPVSTGGVVVLAAIPMGILIVTVGLSLQDPEYGHPAIIGAACAVALGPVAYWLARR